MGTGRFESVFPLRFRTVFGTLGVISAVDGRRGLRILGFLGALIGTAAPGSSIPRTSLGTNNGSKGGIFFALGFRAFRGGAFSVASNSSRVISSSARGTQTTALLCRLPFVIGVGSTFSAAA